MNYSLLATLEPVADTEFESITIMLMPRAQWTKLSFLDKVFVDLDPSVKVLGFVFFYFK